MQIMEVDGKVIAEPVGKTEGDWSSGVRSTAGLPPFAEKEFKRLVDVQSDPSSEADPGATQDEKADLKAHMGALLGEDSAEQTVAKEHGDSALEDEGNPLDEASGLISRLTTLLPGG
jgi:hypothetical protein